VDTKARGIVKNLGLSKDSSNIVLITYAPGTGGFFMNYVLTHFLKDTVKWQNDLSLTDDGCAHGTSLYVEPFGMIQYILANDNAKQDDFEYAIDFREDVDINDKLVLIICDMGYHNDRTDLLLKHFPNSKMLRVYADEFIYKTIAVINLMEKLPIPHRKNSIMYKDVMDKVVAEDMDQCNIDYMQHPFRNSTEWQPGFSCPIEHDQICNINFKSFFAIETFLDGINKIAEFLGTTIIKENELKEVYHHYHSLQKNYDYVNIHKDSIITDNDDLLGRALVKFYKETQ